MRPSFSRRSSRTSFTSCKLLAPLHAADCVRAVPKAESAYLCLQCWLQLSYSVCVPDRNISNGNIEMKSGKNQLRI